MIESEKARLIRWEWKEPEEKIKERQKNGSLYALPKRMWRKS